MPYPTELPPILHTLRHIRIGIQEIGMSVAALYGIALLLLAFATLFGLKHLA